MKKIFTCFCLGLIIISGCSSGKQKGLEYFNDCESIKGWEPVGFARLPVHSGFFSNKLDSIHMYGVTFRLAFKDISPDSIKKVKVSLWVFFNEKSKATLVMELKNKLESGLSWTGIKLEDKVKEIGKWQKVTVEFPIDGNSAKPDNFIWIYPWDNDKKDVYIDDIDIEFITKP
jgi:hypothetical protein